MEKNVNQVRVQETKFINTGVNNGRRMSHCVM